MKATGMYRKVDDLGRIVLPAELRRLFDINEGDRLEIYVDEGQIILSKLEETCAICSGLDRLVSVKGRLVCASCRRQISAMKN